MIAAFAFVLLYAIGGSGNAPVSTVLAAMLSVHFLVGIGEGLITAMTVGAVVAVRPDLVYGAQRPDARAPARFRRGGGEVVTMTATRKGLAAIVIGGSDRDARPRVPRESAGESSSPDGLEKVATDEGFIDTAEDHELADSPLAEYGVDGVEDESLSTGLAGIVGVAITFGIALLLFGIFHARRPKADGASQTRASATAGSARSS